MTARPRPPARILVGCDFSAGSRLALRRAAALGQEHGGQLVLLHVVEPSLPPDEYELVLHELAVEAGRYAEVPTEVHVVAGATSAQLPWAAQQLGADLIVVGAHRVDSRKPSTIAAMVDAAVSSSVPVLVVTLALPGPYTSVVLAVDASAGSFRAAGVGLALTPGAHHAVLHVTGVVGERLIRLHGGRDTDVDHLASVQLTAAAEAVEHLRERLVPQVKTTLIAPGTPQVTVAEVAAKWGADLVVVGTGGSSRLRDLTVGSVTRNTVRRASCDVLVVPTSGNAALR